MSEPDQVSLRALTSEADDADPASMELRTCRQRPARWIVGAATSVLAAAIAISVAAIAGDSRLERLGTTPAVQRTGGGSTNAPAPPILSSPVSTPPPSPWTAAAATLNRSRPCAASDVVARLTGREGAGGHLLRYVRLRNTSTSPCLLNGYPRVTASEPRRPDVIGKNGAFFPTGRTATMRPGHATVFGVETDTYCEARPLGGPSALLYHHLTVMLTGGGTITLNDPSGFDLACGLRLTRFFVLRPQ